MQQKPFELPEWLKRARPVEQARRPRLLTALAVFWIVSGCLMATAGLVGLLGANPFRSAHPLTATITLAIGALFLWMGLGAWNGWPWSRWAAVTVHVMSVPFLLFQPLNALTLISVMWAAVVVWYLTRPPVGAYYRAASPRHEAATGADRR